MNGINNKPGFQSPVKQAANRNARASTSNRGVDFQSALENIRNPGFNHKKKDKTALAAAPAPALTPSPAPVAAAPASPAPAASQSSSNTSTGFATSSQSSTGGTMRGNLSTGPGFRNDANEQRVEQELNNQLVQSGLQAQALKSEPASTREND